MTQSEHTETHSKPPYNIHAKSAHSYSLYLVGLLIGVLFDFIFPIRPFSPEVCVPLGVGIIIFASILILWAQRTFRHFQVNNILEGRLFHKGPYRFTKSPTHLGLALLILGFGILINAFFVVLFTIFFFIVTKVTYIRRRELFLEKKLGDAYVQYKKSVHL